MLILFRSVWQWILQKRPSKVNITHSLIPAALLLPYSRSSYLPEKRHLSVNLHFFRFHFRLAKIKSKTNYKLILELKDIKFLRQLETSSHNISLRKYRGAQAHALFLPRQEQEIFVFSK